MNARARFFLGMLLCLAITAPAAAGPVSIQLKWKHQFQFAGYYAALEKGFYADEGLDVRLIEGGPGHAPVAELLEGRVDYAVADAGVLLDRARGRDVVVLASIFQQSPQVAYTRDDVASVADLKGRRVMLQDGFLTIEVLAMLQHFGISQGDFIRQPIGSIEDLIHGRTDAFPGYSTNEAFLLRKRGIPFRMFRPRDYGIDFYGDTLVTTGRELAEHPERAAAVRRATLRGWAYALEHPREIVDLIRSRYNSQHKSVEYLMYEANGIRDLMLADVVPIGFSNPDRWRHVAETFARQGLLTREVDLDAFLYQPRVTFLDLMRQHRLAIAAGVIAFVLLLLLSYAWLLRRQVRSRTEALIAASREFERIIDRMQDTYYVADAEGRMRWCSASVKDKLGYAREEIIGRPMTMLYEDANDRERFLNALAANGGKVENFPLRLKHKDGRIVHTEVSSQFTYDEAGNVTGVEGTARDVTARKKAEEAAQQARRELEIVFDNMQDTFYRTDAEGRIIWGSASCRRLTGYRLDELIGMPVAQLWVEPEARGKMLEAMHASGGRVENFEVDIRRKNGEIRHVSVNAHFIHDEQGEINGVEGIVRDVTEIRRAAEEHRELEAQFQQAQKMESIGLLAGGIAHDFNNLLVGVMGNAELAMLDLPQDSPVRDYLQQIFHAAQRGSDLVRQMLAYSGQGRMTVAEHNLNQCIRDVGDLLGTVISKKAEVSYDLFDDLPDIRGDMNQITQMLMNLMTNASDALGGEPGSIHVSTGVARLERADLRGMSGATDAEPGDYVFVQVRDSGCGMDQETMKRIFDPFFTTKQSGTGLGLAALMGIVRGHHGCLRLDSAPGKGSCFTVYLPACEASGQAAVMVDTNSFDLPDRLSGTVLIVDDEPDVAQVARRFLEREGLKVLVAGDGEQGVELFRRHADAIGMVLLDLTMPKMDGEQAFHAMRAVRDDVPIVISSGFSESGAVARMRRHGLAGFVQKPFRRKELLGQVVRLGVLDRDLDSVN